MRMSHKEALGDSSESLSVGDADESVTTKRRFQQADGCSHRRAAAVACGAQSDNCFGEQFGIARASRPAKPQPLWNDPERATTM